MNLRNLRETLGFLCADRLSTLACILPQIAQITQRNAASCIITQRKTDWVGGEFLCGSVVLWFVCVNQRDQREILGFLLCGLIEYSCVLFSRR